ncbi:MAG: InlB B-repeat-containing protein [Candidatus Coproplasma sp.]
MKKVKRKIATFLLLSAGIATLAFGFAACDAQSGSGSVYEEYLNYAQSIGQEPLSYEDWISSVKGADGADGKDGVDGKDGENGENGADGKDGATWLTGEGEPSEEIGKDGDIYLDETTCDLYVKESGAWSYCTNIKGSGTNGTDGADGKDGLNGTDGKDGENGADGKDGATWLTGEGEPSEEIGKDGDLYLDKSTCDVYLKADGDWAVIINIKGESGADGESVTVEQDSHKWLTGDTDPDDSDGKNGDWYVNIPELTVFLKVDGAWGRIGEFVSVEEIIPETEYVTVTFDYGDDKITEEKVVKGETATLPCPECEGKVFAGWFYGEGANRCQVNSLTPIISDVTLRAEWITLPTFTFNTDKTQYMVGKTADISGIYTGQSNASVKIKLTCGDTAVSLREAEESGILRIDRCETYTFGEDCELDLLVTFTKDGEYGVEITFTENGITTSADKNLTIVIFEGEIEYVSGELKSLGGSGIAQGSLVTAYTYSDSAILKFYVPETAQATVTVNGTNYSDFTTVYDPEENILTVTVEAEDMSQSNAVRVDVYDEKFGGESISFSIEIDDLSIYDTLKVHQSTAVLREVEGQAEFSYTVCDPDMLSLGAGEFYIVAQSKMYAGEYAGEFGKISISAQSGNTVFTTVSGSVELVEDASVTFSLVYKSADGELLYLEDCVTVKSKTSVNWQTEFSRIIICENEQTTFTATVNASLSSVAVSIDGYEIESGELQSIAAIGKAKYAISVDDGVTTVEVTFSLVSGEYSLEIRDLSGKTESCSEFFVVEKQMEESL